MVSLGMEGPGGTSTALRMPVPRKGTARWKQERRAEEREEPKDSPGLAPAELVLESGRRIRGWSVQVGCLSLPGVLGPRGGQVCAPGAAPEPSLTMAKVKELCLPRVQVLPQMAWGQGPYCSHHLHRASTRKVGLLWPPAPDQLGPCHSQGPALAPPPLHPTAASPAPCPTGGRAPSSMPRPTRLDQGPKSFLVNVASSQRLRLYSESARPRPFTSSQKTGY